MLEHCRVRKMIELESIPTVLHVPKNALGNKLIVGFSDGRVILFRFNPMLMDGMLQVTSYESFMSFNICLIII